MVRKYARRGILLVASVAVVGAVILPVSANAATTIDGPIGLGAAEQFAVLGGAAVSMIPPNPIVGDIGISPGTALSGWQPVTHTGSLEIATVVANTAQTDLTTAYNTAASLTPSQSSLTNLSGPSYGPGVYSGGALSVSGVLTLTGGAESIWVFQAASTLTVATGAVISVTGGASACNVFWQVGTSATIGGGAAFVGTIMADQSITLVTGATVTGRLLARIGAVNMDQNTITRPTGCSTTGGTVRTSPTFTSAGPLAGEEGSDYSYTLSASGTPSATYTVTSGALPTGLTLNATSGLISGRPTTAGTYTFTVTAANGTAPDAAATYTIVIAPDSTPQLANSGAPQLANSGSDLTIPLAGGGALLAAGMALLLAHRARITRQR